MAIVHKATLTPTKAELLTAWLDGQPWGGSGEVSVLGSYRFDDPDGEVGVEGLLAWRGDQVLHVPLTYRGAPLTGADDALVGTLDHSVLGKRWAYRAGADPVARACFKRALRGEQETATFEVYEDGRHVGQRPLTVTVTREGDADAGGDLRLVDVVGADADPSARTPRLVAAWDGGSGVVAFLG